MGDWTQYRSLEGLIECDFHYGRRPEGVHYEDAMAEVASRTYLALQYAQAHGYKYLMFRHGQSTSGPGKRTASSVVRGIMRDPGSTPYVNKKQSIQDNTVFVAKLKSGDAEAPEGVYEKGQRMGPNAKEIPIIFFQDDEEGGNE